MVEQVAPQHRVQINGPVWLERDQFETAKRGALATHPSLDILVDSHCGFEVRKMIASVEAAKARFVRENSDSSSEPAARR